VQVLALRKSLYQRVVANFREDKVMSKHDGHSIVTKKVIHFNYIFSLSHSRFVIYDDGEKKDTFCVSI
jgi:hypothetical protein